MGEGRLKSRVVAWPARANVTDSQQEDTQKEAPPMADVTLAEAVRICDAAIAKTVELGIKITHSVVDSGTNISVPPTEWTAR